jgi:protein TonB
MGMFEQSMLVDAGTGKRTSALAASLTIQTLLVAILIVIPPLYGDRLPVLQPWLSITIPLPRPIAEAPPQEHAAAQSPRTSLLQPRVFHPSYAPQRIPLTGAVISDDPGPVTTSIGIGPAPGFSTNVGMILGPALVPAPIPRPVVETAKESAAPQRVGGDVQEAKLIRKVVPAYPEIARRARVSGTVRLVGVIAKDGPLNNSRW